MARRSLLVHADKLHALRVVFASRSLRVAATTLGVTPSALSQAISVLEVHLGRTLAVRSRHGVTPTPSADQLLASVGPALDAILAAGEPLSASMPKARLRLGAYESLAVSLVPDLVARLGAKHPNLRIAIRTGRSTTLSRLVQRGELDVALVAENDATGSLAVERLTSDRLGLWAAAAYPKVGGGVSRTTPYAGLASGSDGLPAFYRRFVRAAGLSQRPFIECDSFEALRMMAVRQVTVAVLPRRVALRTPGELRAMPVGAAAEGAGTHGICLVWRRVDQEDARRAVAAELLALL